MREGIICAGFGGQGVMIMGRLLAQSAMAAGFEVTWMPSYGAEVRGGTAHSMIVISDELIPSPVLTTPDTCVILNQPSLEKFENKIKPKGTLIINTTMAAGTITRKDLKVVAVPATELASQMGNTQITNMIALGAYIACKKIFPLEVMIEELKNIIPAHRHSFIPINEKALIRGAEFIASL
ncbi:MAG: 2-oxoacid:acceptor oxidoreductase family protein [Candidatus Omnitrophica bacterium]|nr:2-oxoacid:acceptor oxidoreductase family protein [Candidatus Omnitrophota bacterium]